MDNKDKIQGYVVLTDIVGRWELAWRVEDGNGYMPDIYSTVKDCRKEIIDVAMTQMQEYLDDERDWDEIDLDINDAYLIAKISIDDNDNILVTDIDDGSEIISMTLNNWRAQL